ncbi:hypothetical protein NDU88_006231 [Pleurodeles waltl]|uniref:Uncharacterized protein n=1 Tax=Pleurodeles waltl TaxID=8319 RepID=A0AAV7ULI8_PLEWA|nr:hypothetical protein NDU88_006231 [Pleurodeles waltl]
MSPKKSWQEKRSLSCTEIGEDSAQKLREADEGRREKKTQEQRGPNRGDSREETLVWGRREGRRPRKPGSKRKA